MTAWDLLELVGGLAVALLFLMVVIAMLACAAPTPMESAERKARR